MKYEAFVFDAYGTLFDVHSVGRAIHDFFPDKGKQISQEWRSSQIHYFMVRQLADSYIPFDIITRWALKDALLKSDVKFGDDIISALMAQYEKLIPYEEVHSLKEKYPDLPFTIFSNGTKSMLEPLLQNNKLSDSFSLLSADDPKVYKPHPHAYQYAAEQAGADKEEVLFFSSNPWDVAGASLYGFHTAWVNRHNLPWPRLGVEPDYTINNLNSIPGEKL
ncbi:haloacid dehalogenase type II [Halobacillus sp. A5]|uniref:haloacid dehalogenase type II n=1 Tax=Halobacillus sp. A5 TaxID=2880263 RepID=UPI0020A62AB7|nr:haloacid dehalogenase type II [Halobacillus sp. A5]MCP3028134.1 haloacid dehalogenase type II [Halobacillus sp. A5]